MRSLTRPSRRGVLAAGGALTVAAAASACDLAPTGSSTDEDREPARVDPDLRRVETVTAQVRELLALTATVGVAQPSAAVSVLEECHRAHLSVLDPSQEEQPSSSPTPTVSATPDPSADRSPDPSSSPAGSPSGSPGPTDSAGAALQELLAREQAHVTTLIAEAGVAESGALARLLASMAAGVGMHLPGLDAGADA